MRTRAQVDRLLRGDQWNVGLATLDPNRAPSELDLGSVQWLPRLRADTYLADPFIARRDGKTALLLEEFDQREKRGVINAVELDPERLSITDVHRAIIDPGTHVSYPYLLDVGAELFCVPEAARSRAVTAWRCLEFPARWEPYATLLADIEVVDPTVFRSGDRWWLFGTMRGEHSNSRLHAWYAPRFEGPYVAHPGNPIKVDSRSSRGAGRLFRRRGRLYRPAQDCSHGYGEALTINRVDRLTPTEFAETTVRRVEPADGYEAGIHTFNELDGLTVIDGNRRVFELTRVRRELRARLGIHARRQ